MIDEKVSTLAFAPVSLPKEGLSGNLSRSAATFFDFVIDGVPLRPVLRTDDIGVLSDAWDSDLLARHLLLDASIDDRLENRALIYGCRECLDINCGGITAEISKSVDRIRWERIDRLSIDWIAGCDLEFEPIDAGPFTFDLAQYRTALQPFLR
jgi:hypothetical protein